MELVANGIKMRFVELGDHTALPVVFVHGMTFDHEMWQPQIELLRETCHVVAYDFRGHGKSEAGDGQFTYRQLVEDLIALLDHLGIHRAVLCGLSMGGAISLRTIEMFPQRVRALILCDTTGNPDSNQSKYWREKAIQSIKQEGLRSFADDFLKSIFAPSTFETHPDIIERMRHTIVSSSPLGIRGALLAQAARTDLNPALPNIGVPTLIMVGEEDSLTPPAIAQAMHESIKGSELRIIPNAGHMSNLENTEAFNKHLLEFLRNIE
jgi:3-oxoadipate enol-lactonase